MVGLDQDGADFGLLRISRLRMSCGNSEELKLGVDV